MNDIVNVTACLPDGSAGVDGNVGGGDIGRNQHRHSISMQITKQPSKNVIAAKISEDYPTKLKSLTICARRFMFFKSHSKAHSLGVLFDLV